MLDSQDSSVNVIQVPRTEEILSPKEYISLYNDHKDNIKSVRILSPEMRPEEDRYFIVEYNRPVYK